MKFSIRHLLYCMVLTALVVKCMCIDRVLLMQ